MDHRAVARAVAVAAAYRPTFEPPLHPHTPHSAAVASFPTLRDTPVHSTFCWQAVVPDTLTHNKPAAVPSPELAAGARSARRARVPPGARTGAAVLAPLPHSGIIISSLRNNCNVIITYFHVLISFPEPRYCRPPSAPCEKSRYRSQDGSCNNLENPLRWGVSNTPFRRVLPASYGDG